VTSQQFKDSIKAILEDIETTLTAKNADYAGDQDPLKNFRQIEILTNGRVSLQTGILTRMSDKLSRIGTLLDSGKDPAVAGEPLKDAYRDLAGYCVVALADLQDGPQVAGGGTLLGLAGVGRLNPFQNCYTPGCTFPKGHPSRCSVYIDSAISKAVGSPQAIGVSLTQPPPNDPDLHELASVWKESR